MNALVVKEIRLLMPAYGMALILAMAPAWLLSFDHYRPDPYETLYPFWLGAVMLALSSFGREFGMRTFPLLMAQPLERSRIWWTKIAVLATALTTVLAAWYGMCVFCGWDKLEGMTSGETVALGCIFGAVAFSGGLWATLLLRQIAAAFWFAILVPGVLLMLVFLKNASYFTGYVVMSLYALAGFVLAARLFFRAQEVAWTGGVVDLSRARSADIESRTATRSNRPWRSLFRKELQLHQINLLGIAGLFVAHLGVIALRHSSYPAQGSMLRSALEIFGGFWLIVPLVAASTSVAEERKLGTMESHLCLPISSRIQFAFKLLFVLALGGILSPLLLGIAEGIGTALGADAGMTFMKKDIPGQTILFLGVPFLGLSLVSFYASTLARHMVQAMAIAAVSSIGVWMVVRVAVNPTDTIKLWLWEGPLVHLIAWPILVVTFVWLAYRNFLCASENAPFWRRNAIGMIGALTCIVALTSGLYHRAWELVMPLEPAHGPARLVGAKPANLGIGWGGTISVLLPNGQLWFNDRISDPGNQSTQRPPYGVAGYVRQHWLKTDVNQDSPGSNWVQGVANLREIIAVQADGSLWNSEKPLDLRQTNYNGLTPDQLRLRRVGNDTNWQSAVWESHIMAILLRRDGTLWSWGTNSSGPRSTNRWPGLQAFAPQRLGTASDWKDISSLRIPYKAVVHGWKRDGSAFVIGTEQTVNPRSPKEVAEPGTGIYRQACFDQVQGLRWLSIGHCSPFEVGLREDGTLWSWSGYWQRTGNSSDWIVRDQSMPIGQDKDWLAIAIAYDRMVALKKDGSLWSWTIDPERRESPDLAITKAPTRLGTHTDWKGIAMHWTTLSLASDGSLWYWNRRGPNSYDSDHPAWLGQSRRPIKICSLFEEQP